MAYSRARREGTRSNYNAGAYYVDGSTVRKTAPVSPYHNTRAAGARSARTERQSRNLEIQHKKALQQRRNEALQQKKRAQQRSSSVKVKPRVYYADAVKTASVSLTFPLTLLLVAAMAVCVVIGYKYLCLKSSLDVHMDNIKSLETRLDTLRTENDALEKSIDTSVDLNEVYEVATGKLGMVRVGQDNIIQYDKTESEYVKQYEDIPSGN